MFTRRQKTDFILILLLIFIAGAVNVLTYQIKLNIKNNDTINFIIEDKIYEILEQEEIIGRKHG